MLTFAISLLLVAVTSAHPSSSEPPSSHVVTRDSPDTGGLSLARVAKESRGLADLIFTNDFETGTHAWSSSTAFSQFETTMLPSFDVSTCNLPPGDYVFKLDTDNNSGGHSYEYPLTVTEVPCPGDPLSTCLDLEFGEAFISFR